LPTAALSLAGPAPYWQSWTFADQTGNRATQVDHRTTGDATTTYTYGTSGQAQPNRLVSTNAGTYGYDSAGNTTSRPGPHGQQTLTWDIEGHLASATDTTGTTSYVYDGSGNRLVARDPTGATLYLPGMELRLTTSTDTVAGTRYYQHNGRNVAQRTPQGVTWLSVDALSTTSVAIDSTTQSATIRRQTPYGTTRGATTWVNPHGFMGGVDGPTGLTHIGARDYDAATGRFVSVDPVFDRRSPQTWNGYAYAGNAPVTYADRSGTRRCLPDDDGCEEINGTTVHAPHKDPLEVVVHKVYSNGTILKKYRNGTVTINGLGIPPGCKDPFLLAQTVDDLWGREQTEAPVVDHFDPPTAARTLTLMLQACNTVGCSRDFKENVAQARNHLVEAVISHDRELARDLVFAKAGIITAGTLFCLFGGEEVCGPALFFSFLGFTTANASVYLSGNHPKWTEFFIAEGIDLASAYAGMFGGGGWGISKIEDFPRYADWTLRSTSAASGGGLLLDSTSVEQWTIMNEADEDEGPADLGAVSIGP
jgi:RHS repeat-associated protein